jgi:hypothetical protein
MQSSGMRLVAAETTSSPFNYSYPSFAMMEAWRGEKFAQNSDIIEVTQVHERYKQRVRTIEKVEIIWKIM